MCLKKCAKMNGNEPKFGRDIIMSKKPFQKTLVASSVSMMLGLAAPAFAAEENQTNADSDVERMEVSGYRSSVIKAQALKRDAVGSQDSIVAEDIADFPDLNLAESLQRIPGVTITRDNGEGRQIALRGLGADFTRTQLNGMEALATNASILDSRGSVSRTRSFDFNIFASELFNQIDVYKTFEAKQDEGGIAGTVNLRTPKPFDYDGFNGAVSAKGGYNSVSEEYSPRFAALVSNTWNDFGVTFSAAHSKSKSVEFGHRNWQWEKFKVGSFADNLSAADISTLSNEDLAYPVANTLSSVSNNQTRTGITTALQYRPNDSWSFTADIIYGKLDSDAREYNIATRGYDQINDYEIQGNSLVYANYLSADMRNESKLSQSTTEFNQYVLEVDGVLTDDLTMSAKFGYSKSEFDAPVHDKVYLIAEDHEFSFDYRDSKAGNNTYDFDIADPAAYKLHRADNREDFISNEFTTFKVDFNYALNDFSDLDFGVQYKDYVTNGYERRNTVRNLEDSGISFSAGAFSIASTSPFAVADVAATMPNIVAAGMNARGTDIAFSRDLGPEFNRPGTAYDVQEETLAAYLQYNFEVENVRANFGVRYVTTDVTSDGSVFIKDNGTFEDVSVSNDYAEWLPSLNLAIDLTDDVVMRFAANRNLSRPSLGDLRAAADINLAGAQISNGNPELKPFIADSFDLGLEYYFGEADYIALGLFSKDMASFVVTESDTVSYAETGLPLSLQPPGDEGREYNISRPVNGEGATLTGAEFALQYEFLAGLGLIANVTYAESSTENDINGESVKATLLGLSKVSYNLTAYYETDNWGARVSQAYRDGYLERVIGFVNDFQGVESTSYFDASVYYNITENLKISLEGINLTNEKLYRYQDITDRRATTVYESGRNILLGVNYRF
ncbi:TonB-dependent receptor [Shewanella sp. OPT22]|nr:TonB-dependent receptor [Shewanella sp. OPT22]